MVDKESMDWIKAELGKAIHPYNNDAELTNNQALSELNYYMNRCDFVNSDKVLLHGSPSHNENEARYTLFEKAAIYLKETDYHQPTLYAHSVFEDLVEESEFLDTNDVNFIDADITEDEINAIYNPPVVSKFLNKSEDKKKMREFEKAQELAGAEKRIHVTSDYHAEGVDSLNNQFDLEDYLILSTDTSGEKFSEENYTNILGPLSPVANALSSLGVSWRTWAEGKEGGRKMMDSIRDPRF